MANVPMTPSQLKAPAVIPANAPMTTSQLPMGVTVKSPQTNITPPPNTAPANQQNLKDLSQNYANVNGTIYNKSRGASGGLSTWDQFLQEANLPSGTSGTTLKFDTTWTPPSNSTPSSTPTPNNSTTPNPTATNNPNPTNSSPTGTGSYSPPNGGTTGVSQGGIIGNLIGIANNETPEVTKARKDLEDLQNSNAQAVANIDSEPIDLSLAAGQKGILSQLFAAKSGAAQTALSSALTSQGQQIGATQSAGSLNAPIVTQPGSAILNPSSNSTVGGTSSGASSLSSLIGQRPSPSNPNVTEYYNTQTGQGFSSPQQLSDFINQQVPNAGATPQNVFDLLKSGSLNGGGGNIVGVNSGTIDNYVQMVLSGQANQIPSSVTGNIALWNQVLQKAQQQNPNLNLNQINASVSANTGIYNNSLANVQTLNTALNNVKQLGSMTVENANGAKVNPFNLVPGNQALASIRNMLSSTGQATFNSNMAQLQAAIQNLYAQGGGNTPTNITSAINQMADGSISVDGLKALLSAAENEGQILLSNAQNQASSAYTNINANNVGAGSGTTAPQGWF